MSTYSEKLKHPNWQRKRLQILQNHQFTCDSCESTTNTLHVHHGYYKRGADPWDYPDDALHVLCEDCHAESQQKLTELYRLIGLLPPNMLEFVQGVVCSQLYQYPVPFEVKALGDVVEGFAVGLGVQPGEIEKEVRNGMLHFDGVMLEGERAEWISK
jgi:hypothetical protein